MKRKLLFLFALILIVGCTYAGKEELSSYLHDPKVWIKDPHFGEYKQKRDELESRYLQKKISYAEYLEKRNELDEKYAREVQERNAKISGE